MAITAGSARTDRTEKCLTFALAEEAYGIGILKVQEIIGVMPVTRVPRTPDFVRGVINLRGKVIPVVDLRLRLGLERVPDTERTCIIVVQVDGGPRRVTMGVLVDEVSEVLDIPPDQVEAAPEFGSGVQTEFILGMGKVGRRVVLLLDIDRVLSARQLEIVESAARTDDVDHDPEEVA